MIKPYKSMWRPLFGISVNKLNCNNMSLYTDNIIYYYSILNSFNHWSRHEPIQAELTDHWSKLRCKVYILYKLLCTTMFGNNYMLEVAFNTESKCVDAILL